MLSFLRLALGKPHFKCLIRAAKAANYGANRPSYSLSRDRVDLQALVKAIDLDNLAEIEIILPSNLFASMPIHFAA